MGNSPQSSPLASPSHRAAAKTSMAKLIHQPTPTTPVSSLRHLPPRKVNNFKSWTFWSRLDRLRCLKRSPLTDEDFHVVLTFLRMGNFTASDGSVRMYHTEELHYAGGSLEDCRKCITKFVQHAMGVVIQQSENPAIDQSEVSLLVRALKNLVGNKTWDLDGHNPEVYALIREHALTRLQQIATQGEGSLFPKIKGAFDDVVVPPNGKPRLDDAGVLPFDALQGFFKATVGDIPPHDHEVMVVFEYLAKVRPNMQRARCVCVSNRSSAGLQCY